MVFVVFLYIEIYRAVAHVGIAVVKNLLHQLLLLDDMTRGVGLDRGGKHVEHIHSLVVAVGIVLGYLHRLELLQSGLLLYLVVALIGVVLQMAHVGDVAHIAHFVAQMLQVSEEDIKRDGGAGVAQMGVAIYGGAAHIHAHVGGMQRLEGLLLARQRVINQ